MEIPLVKKKACTNDIINRQANIEGKKRNHYGGLHFNKDYRSLMNSDRRGNSLSQGRAPSLLIQDKMYNPETVGTTKIGFNRVYLDICAYLYIRVF